MAKKLYKDKEWLRYHYVDLEMSQAQIAKLAGCGVMTISKYMKRYHIPARDMSTATKMAWPSKRRAAQAERARAARKLDWQDPEYRKRMAEVMRASWSPEKRKTRKTTLGYGKGRVNIACMQCGYEYSISRATLEHGGNKGRFCSPECVHEWTRENVGDPSEYPREWNDAFKEQVRDMDGGVCVMCGKTRNDDGSLLSVHHIDHNKQNTTLENCITLCRNCHRSAHTRDKKKKRKWIRTLRKLAGLDT